MTVLVSIYRVQLTNGELEMRHLIAYCSLLLLAACGPSITAEQYNKAKQYCEQNHMTIDVGNTGLSGYVEAVYCKTNRGNKTNIPSSIYKE